MRNIIKFFFIIASAFSATAISSTDPIVEQQLEREILSFLFDATDGVSWTKNNGWKDPLVHCCDWYGVQCTSVDSSTRERGRVLQDQAVDESRTVESIDLSENNLRGSVPISLLLLFSNIRSIRLNGNDVDFSKVAEQETKILSKALDLSSASVQSTISHYDVSHTSVKQLSRLFTTGSGDTVIETPNMKAFYASQSKIRGKFPNFLMDIKGIERIALDHNGLTGSIPNTIGNLSHLKYLSLSDNQITGKIPNTVTGLKQLRYMLMEMNRLTGTIPMGLASVEYTPLLEQLDLSNQREKSSPLLNLAKAGLSGPIPSFSTQKRLRRVDLGVNSLTGSIPSNLLSETDFSDFDFFILSSNFISGSIPSQVLSRVPTDDFFVDDNKITELKNCPFSEFQCAAILCPPGSYEPRSGRQEEEERPCLDCPENTQYWGQTFCELDNNAPSPGVTPPTLGPTREPGAPPTTNKPTSTPMQSPTIPNDSVDERAILSDLYEATGSTKWNTKDGWDGLKGDLHFCEWHGVVCVSEDVQSVEFLNLDSNSLVGSLPDSIYQLPNLKLLDLSQNDGLTTTFKNIGKAKSLEAVDFSRTIIETVDGILEAAETLQQLDMKNVVGFQGGNFPIEIFELTNLRQLSLDYNQASGTLPSTLGKLSKLIIFSASDNELFGPIPDEVTNLSGLTVLRLSTNHLSGTLPSGMESLNSLAVLDLSNQWSNGVDDDYSDEAKPGIHGPLPSFSKLSQLRRLDLAVNSFSGTIPNNFLANVDPENLFESADISENFLEGTVPSGVARLPQLFMQDNFLTGISSEVCESIPDDLKEFGCDAVLCKPGFSNSLGRRSSDGNPCAPCAGSAAAKYYGSTDCSSGGDLLPEKPTATPERLALELIFTECNGLEWSSKKNWLHDEVSTCLWDGISCDGAGNVTEIDLRSNSLTGAFPSEVVFKSIPSLTKLVLDGNSVTFDFQSISEASNLKILDLTKTGINSVAGIGPLQRSLTDLFLSSNNLKGSFPSEILQLTGLIHLALHFNDLSGTVPLEISNLSNLEYLSIHDNEFTGTIPTTLGEISNLNFLLLQSNNFFGIIPTQINLLEHLGFFSLKGQRGNDGKGLSGGLPSFATLNNLKKMDLSKNQLSGTVPANFLDQITINSFQHVSLADNLLSGELPSVLSKLSVNEYDFTGNRISTISSKLCDTTAYGCNAVLCPIGKWNKYGRQLHDDDVCEDCPSSKFWGAINCNGPNQDTPTPTPVSDSTLTPVEILSMVYDKTQGVQWHRKDNWKVGSTSVCEWYGIRCNKNGDIQHIVLSANNMDGTIPSEVFQLPNLITLNVDSNLVDVDFRNINAGLEILDISESSVKSLAGIAGAKSMRELHMKQIGLTGALPLEIFDLTNLEQLDFDFNSFAGPLKHGIGKLTNLKQLNGAQNKLTGVIPNELGELTNLITLRLGRNSFDGNLPAEALDQMTSLAYIDLSYQKEQGGPGLSGELPPLTNLKSLTQIRLKGNAFSGTVPYDFLKNVNHDEFQYADLSSNSLTGTLASSIALIGDIYLQNNMISGFPTDFCDAERGAAYKEFECDAFLCKPGTFSAIGRAASNETRCAACPEAIYYGSSSCGEESSVDEKSILVELYKACRGDVWDESDNWLNDDQSICKWTGVRCAKNGFRETVEALELGANNLKGTPPTELYTLPNLSSLSFYSNPLDSVSFEGIQNANKLTELLLDATGIVSIAGLEKAPKLEKLNLRFNRLSGHFPSEITEISSLHTLTMAYNNLSGTLPRSIEEMNLQALLLSHNELSGKLQNVNFPQSIRRLDLSDNSLTGSIPDSFLATVPFDADLEVDLSSNRLTGTIPTDLVRFEQLNLYLKDNRISKVDKKLCRKTKWNDGDVGRYGCNGLLCPTGQYSANGRQTASGSCRQCPNGGSHHVGASTCDNFSAAISFSTISKAIVWGLLAFLSVQIIF